ncbi:MAG TPA: hypothetical protein PLZ86_05540 [bacterium]|nr:hypothetical protein [bacterium]
MRKTAACILMASLLAFSSGCAGQKEAKTAGEQDFTLGLVQKNIRVGMAQAEVAEALGSPNIVTKDAEGHESWVYDKIASQVKSGGSGGYWTLILVGGSWGHSGRTSTQKTLTVVIRFDAKSRVKSVSYHASKF